MATAIKCPNSDCPTNGNNAQKFVVSIDESKFYIKKGYYKTKHNHQPVPRYKCKHCGANFSSHTHRETVNQHKPHVNESVFKLVSSGVTLRRTAKILGITKRTVEKKFHFLSELAKKAHEKFLSDPINKTCHVQFDEMETYQHTKCKPLSVSIAVTAGSGHIIDAKVAVMMSKGKLAPFAHFKYPYWNKDTRKEATLSVMESIKKVAFGVVTIASDAKKVYPSLIKKILPEAIPVSYVTRKAAKKEDDPLFTLNHTAAMLRADMSRMRRRTWACTKKWENLQKHLYLYIAWNNKYQLAWNFT